MNRWDLTSIMNLQTNFRQRSAPGPRMIASLTEEVEAIGWYEQRLAVEPNQQARAIMANAEA